MGSWAGQCQSGVMHRMVFLIHGPRLGAGKCVC
jgi:hypothetical protein